MPTPLLAVLIDAENIAADHYPALRDQMRGLGEPIIQRLFGDFSGARLSSWREHAVTYGLQPTFQLNGGKGKNSTDIALTVNAMDLMHGGKVGGICLVSSDRDFAPLAQRLREGGLRVYGFGRKTSDAALSACCTQFFELPASTKVATATAIPKAIIPKPFAMKPAAKPSPVQTNRPEPARIAAFLHDLAENSGVDGWVQLSFAATALRTQDPAMASLLCGKGKFLKNLKLSEAVEVKDSATAIMVRARARFVRT